MDKHLHRQLISQKFAQEQDSQQGILEFQNQKRNIDKLANHKGILEEEKESDSKEMQEEHPAEEEKVAH